MKFNLNLLRLSIFLILITSMSAQANPEAKIYEFESDDGGFRTKTIFYDNGEEVVAFDTQFTEKYAKQSIQFLKAKTRNPIRYLVISQPNPDKFNAIPTFKELGTKIIASTQTKEAMKGVHEYKKYYWINIAKAFTEATYPKLGNVDIVFSDTYDLKLKNGEMIKLSELGSSGVSTNQTVSYIPKRNAIVVGDLIHYKTHAWLEGGIKEGKPNPNLTNWIKTLESLNKIGNSTTVVYGGRGDSENLFTAIREEIGYLKEVDELVTDYVDDLREKKEELKSDQASKHYQELQKIIAKKFPDYRLDYMIGYGIYGLVNSKLK